MIESAKPNIPTLALRGKNGAINVGRETIRMLNYPTHITILHGKNMRYFAVLPCEERFVLSFATPENFLKNKNIKFTIHSKEYTHDLMKSCGLSTDRTYQFIGVYVVESSSKLLRDEKAKLTDEAQIIFDKICDEVFADG